jgi:hypothetical protein
MAGETWQQFERRRFIASEVEMRRGAREGLVEWLCARPWDWFATMTFRGIPSVRYCASRWSTFMYEFGSRTVRWVRVSELQERGAWHYHALLGDVGEADRFQAMRLWWQLAGIARIFPARQDAAVRYCAKYLVKEKSGEVLWDVGGWGGPSCSIPKGGAERS